MAEINKYQLPQDPAKTNFSRDGVKCTGCIKAFSRYIKPAFTFLWNFRACGCGCISVWQAGCLFVCFLAAYLDGSSDACMDEFVTWGHTSRVLASVSHPRRNTRQQNPVARGYFCRRLIQQVWNHLTFQLLTQTSGILWRTWSITWQLEVISPSGHRAEDEVGDRLLFVQGVTTSKWQVFFVCPINRLKVQLGVKLSYEVKFSAR